MKDWYCKPASYEEAVEIVERAIANGAKEYEWPARKYSEIENEYRWNLCIGWGCLSGKTYTADDDQDEDFENAENITIKQVRERFPLPSDKKEWPYRGCKATVDRLDFDVSEYGEKFIGRDVTVMAIFENCIGNHIVAVELNNGACCCFVSEMIKPIKSPRQKWIEAAAKEFYAQELHTNNAAFGAIYDAMVSGEILIPEV